MTGTVSDDCLTDLVAAELAMDVREEASAEWPLALSRHSCVATIADGSAEPIQGFGCGPTAGDSRQRAVMECLERYAQFGCTAPRTRVGTGASLGAAAISPEALGLYSIATTNTTLRASPSHGTRKERRWNGSSLPT